ncbi:unnamed protein product [Mytilus coruscus]|uniref:Uncharacterized protein n=1 Tax=Mytilus coruscus TaxID=42192 RepID=A0A6J8C754_MYTCO|nr:unnamed protein product [Mytilus coruscus]
MKKGIAFDSITNVHIFENSTSQDADVSSEIMVDVVTDLVKVHLTLKKFHLFSDNAGCYKSSTTLAQLHCGLETLLVSLLTEDGFVMTVSLANGVTVRKDKNYRRVEAESKKSQRDNSDLRQIERQKELVAKREARKNEDFNKRELAAKRESRKMMISKEMKQKRKKLPDKMKTTENMSLNETSTENKNIGHIQKI